MDHVKNSVNCWKAKAIAMLISNQAQERHKSNGKVQRLDGEKPINNPSNSAEKSLWIYDIVRHSWKQENTEKEQPLPPNGVCNLGSLDLSKFINKEKTSIDWNKLEVAVKLATRFLDAVVSKTSYPTEDIEEWAIKNRAIGISSMGFADYCLMREIAYGSTESAEELENIEKFIYEVAEKESILLGEKYGVPEMCKMLPVPRRNITLLTVAPAGTVSLIAGCSSGIEPVFSEITIRNDKTGTYTFVNDLANQPYFRCAVSSNGATEVTWEEHIRILSSAQKYVDSGVSKTVNFPNHAHRETIAKAFIMAWKMGCKGLAVYRNGSRKTEVLSPKNLKKDKCPICENDIVTINNQKKCLKCNWKVGDSNVKGDGMYVD